jgi:glycosyltransferase 2 family protein
LNPPAITKPAKRRWAPVLRYGVTLLAAAIMVYLFWPFVGELRGAWAVLQTAHWGWFVVAILVHFLSYASLTGLNILLLKPFQGRIGFWRMMSILPSIAFIEVALPSGGASGLVQRVRFLGRGGYSLEAATFTNIMETIYLSVFMVGISLTGLWYLIRNGDLRTGQLIILAALTVTILVGSMLAYRAGRERSSGKAWAGRLLGYWNRLMLRFHRAPYSQEQLEPRLDLFYDGLAHFGRRPRWPFLLTAGGRVLLDVATLGVCMAIFHYSMPLGALLTAYGLTLVMSGLAALPGGLGLAELSTAVIYARLGAPGVVAVAAALSYRLIAFWLIRLVGFITWQFLEVRA